MPKDSELKIDDDGFVSGKAPTAEELYWVYQNLHTPLSGLGPAEEIASKHGISPGAVSVLKWCREDKRNTQWLMDKITPKGIGGTDDAAATKAALDLNGLERDTREDWNKCLAAMG